MNKKYIPAAVISLAVNLTGMLVNYLHFQKTDYLLFSLKSYGGEFMGESGFGLYASHIYTMLPDGNDIHSLRFSPFGFLLSFLLVFAAAYLILTAARQAVKLLKRK